MNLLCLLLAMASTDVAGRYELTDTRETASELALHPDGTFDFALIYGAGDFWAKGKWTRDGDSVVLDSTGEEKQKVRLLRSGTHSGDFRVRVQGPGGAPAQHMEITIAAADGRGTERTDHDGYAVFPEVKPRTVAVHVPVYDVDFGPVEVKDGHNNFVFELDGKAITELRLKSKRLRIASGALEWTEAGAPRPVKYEKRGN